MNTALRRVPVGAVYALGVVPLFWAIWQGATGGLGVDPVKGLEQVLGLRTLQLLIATMAITPLRRVSGLNLIRFRRALGLLAFGYAVLHLAVWLGLDMQLRWAEILADLAKRPYVMVGMLGFALLVPLAITSNDKLLRRMGGRAWRRLHRLAYPAILAGALHFVLLQKTWNPESLTYLAVILALLGLRVAPIWAGRVGQST